MAKFTQQFFQPGWWNVSGKPMRFTKGELSDRCDNTEAFIQANPAGGVPIFPKHPAVGSVEGGPRLADRDARDCLGWVESTKIDGEGKCHVTYDIRDQATITGINNGTIRFSSPEFSAGDHCDAKGRNYGKIFRHFSMTPAPRNREQGKIESAQFSEDCIQFSEDDFMGKTKADVDEKAAQFADDELKKKQSVVDAIDKAADTEEAAEPEPESPIPTRNADELPTNDTEVEVDGEHTDQQTLNGLTLQIQEIMGIVLPENADAVAVLTAIVNKAKADKEAAAALSGELEVEEEPSVAQFSEEGQAIVDALREENVALKAKGAAESLVKHRASVTAAIATARIPKRMKSRLSERANALQFAEGGEEEPTLTIKQAIALFEEGIPSSIQFAEEDVAEVDHPEGEAFYEKEGAEQTDEEADRAADEQIANSGFGGGGFTGGTVEYVRDYSNGNATGTAVAER